MTIEKIIDIFIQDLKILIFLIKVKYIKIKTKYVLYKI